MNDFTWTAEADITAQGVERDDGGMALVFEVGDDPFFVRLQSWDEAKEHPVFQQLLGRRVRVTVETID